MPRRPRRAAAAGSARGQASSRPVHTGVPVSTWNRISSCWIPGSPPSIRTSSGPASTVAPVDGSRSTNSSSTPSVIAPAARTAPGRPPRTVAARPAPPGPGLTTPACCSGSGRSGSRGPSALARPATARAAGISGHSSAASVREAAACTATASAQASVTTCPAAFRVASSGCSAGIGRVRAIVGPFCRAGHAVSPRPYGRSGCRPGGDEGAEPGAAAPGHARCSLHRPGRGGAGRVLTRDEHGGGGRAAAAGPGTWLR